MSWKYSRSVDALMDLLTLLSFMVQDAMLEIDLKIWIHTRVVESCIRLKHACNGVYYVHIYSSCKRTFTLRKK